MKLQTIIRSALLFPCLLLTLLTSRSQAQSDTPGAGIVVSGKVNDEAGKPVAGVTVQVKGTGDNNTITREDGTFKITVSKGDAVLVLSHIEYETQEVPVNNQITLTVSLRSNRKMLDDVVVIGYGTQKKRNVTGAVANFDATRLTERPVNRVDQALVGQMAGVAVKQTTGALGKGMSVQVRGTGSITAGNEPLYVIDGFPLSTAAPNGSGNFALGNPLDNINPNDIESVQVLKDAAAAAIYGSRAANGVVLITTRRGQTGKAKINFNSYIGYSERARKLDMLSADEWVDRATEMINAQWVASGAGRTADQTNEQRRVILGLAPGAVNTSYMTDDRWSQPGHPGLRYIDWQDEGFRKGLTQNHQVSASGGNEYVRYYVSGNFNRQEGMVHYMDYTSYSARANVEINASKKLKLGINLSPTYSITNDPGVEGKDNILHQMVSFTPVQEDTMGIYPNVDMDGQYRWSVSPNSPIAKLKYTVGETKRFRTLTSMYAEYQVIKGLTLKTTLNLDNTDNNSKNYVPYIIASTLPTRIAQQTALTSGSFTGYRRQTFVNENTLSFTRTIADVHDISALAGISYNSDKIDNLRISSQNGFSNDYITTLNAASAVTGLTGEARNVLLSYFGRVQYGYDGKYLLSASLRRDGSSRFGSNTRWGWFPSASVGWRISQESFMRDISFISDLKLRGSWGTSGNYNIGDYSSIAVLGFNNYTFNGVQVVGQSPTGIASPNLSWERAETWDVGLDIGILGNRITASFDYYNKLNSDLLLNVPILGGTGFSSYLSNAGKARNKGWEIEISTRNMVGEFQWTTSANLSHNTNKVVELAGGQNQILIPSSFDIPHAILRVGQPMYAIYAVKQIGILSKEDIAKGVPLFGSQVEGDPKYFDYSQDGVIDANDRMIVGHPNPDYIWGVTNNFRYKGFDLSVLVQGQWGGSIYSLLGRALGRTGQGFTDNALGFFRDRWRSASDPGAGKVGKAWSTFGRIINTDWLYSSDYIRVRNITLGYDAGRLFKSKNVLQAARVYITAENFFGHDRYKGGFNPEATNTDLSGNAAYPEAGDYGGLPLPRSLIVGVNITF